ncbi:hypothetical protein CF335_g8560, partial [Tilletia laevis]
MFQATTAARLPASPPLPPSAVPPSPAAALPPPAAPAAASSSSAGSSATTTNTGTSSSTTTNSSASTTSTSEATRPAHSSRPSTSPRCPSAASSSSHGTNASLLLTGSDDMTIKLWEWDKNWRHVQDSNTFASSCLDRTVKVWSLGSSQANYTLEVHDKGVNYVEYYHGSDKPYLITTGDDRTVKIWDYL